MPLQATVRYTGGHTALNHTIGQVCNGGNSTIGGKEVDGVILVHGRLARDIMRGIEIESLLLFLPISLVATDADAQVEGQAVGNTPIILEIGFKQLVSVVVLEQMILLSEAVNIPQQ